MQGTKSPAKFQVPTPMRVNRWECWLLTRSSFPVWSTRVSEKRVMKIFDLENLEQLWIRALQARNEHVLRVTDLLRQIQKYENNCWQKGPCSWTVCLTVAKTRHTPERSTRTEQACFPSIACQAPRLGASGISWARGCLLYLIAAHTLFLHKLVQALLKWCEHLASTTPHGRGRRR